MNFRGVWGETPYWRPPTLCPDFSPLEAVGLLTVSPLYVFLLAFLLGLKCL